MSRWEPIGLPRIEWGATLCCAKECAELAECSFDGWPYCLLHAEDALETWVARDLNPAAADAILAARE